MVIVNAPQADSTAHYEQEAMRLTNAARRQHGLPPLQYHSSLAAAAKKHSATMAKYRYLGHHEPHGPDSPMRRAEKAGYDPYMVAENVYGPNLGLSVIDHAVLTPQDAVNGWLGSKGHRRNLLDPRAKHVGFGYVDGFWTQLFGAP